MAKKRTDRHTDSARTLRLPRKLDEAWAAFARDTHRTLTGVAEMALEKLLTEEGYWPWPRPEGKGE